MSRFANLNLCKTFFKSKRKQNKKMRIIFLKRIQMHKNILVALTLTILILEVILFFNWSDKTEILTIDKQQLYIELDSHIIEVFPGYLRINPASQCSCRRDSYIKLNKTNSDTYDVYSVRKIEIFQCEKINSRKKEELK